MGSYGFSRRRRRHGVGATQARRYRERASQRPALVGGASLLESRSLTCLEGICIGQDGRNHPDANAIKARSIAPPRDARASPIARPGPREAPVRTPFVADLKDIVRREL